MKLTNLACILGLLALPAQAATVVFDFGNGTNTGNNSQNGGDGNSTPFTEGDTISAVNTTISGVTMTLNGTAVDGNATADEFWGINNQGIGIITDNTTNGLSNANDRRIDGSIGESITFSFDMDVLLVSARFGSFNGDGVTDETITVTPNGQSAIIFTESATSPSPTTDHSLGNVFVAAGTDITITTTQAIDNGILFNEITVETIPEPSSAALVGLAGLGFILRRRR